MNDISGVKTWNKINEGMMKMWKAEVLGKFPVMQHFRFGKIIAYESPSESARLAAEQSEQNE